MPDVSKKRGKGCAECERLRKALQVAAVGFMNVERDAEWMAFAAKEALEPKPKRKGVGR